MSKTIENTLTFFIRFSFERSKEKLAKEKSPARLAEAKRGRLMKNCLKFFRNGYKNCNKYAGAYFETASLQAILV